jgi:hypothetical protein
MFSRRLMWCTAGLFCALSSTAYATEPAELYELPVPQACLTQLGAMGFLVKARDQGISSEQAQANLRKVRSDIEISKELVANVFDYPDLGMNALERYTLWSCHARAHIIRPLPLKEVAEDTRECYANSRPQECAIILQNRITGLPPGYRPRSFMPPSPARR